MNLLIDTHAFLWYAWGNAQLTQTARAAIENPQNQVFVSVASLWEMTIKVSIGKLVLNKSLEDFWLEQIDENGFRVLPIERPHLLTLAQLPFHHKDPFDRLLIAQSIADKMPFITGDAAVIPYSVSQIW